MDNGGTGGTASKGGASGDTGKGGDTGSSGSGATGGGTDAGPPPPGEWLLVTNNLTGMSTDCGISGVWAKPSEDMLITGVGSLGLFASTDGGATWQALGTGKNSTPVQNRIMQIIFDPDDNDVFYESGIYGPGVFRTDDDGKTFSGLNVQHNDSVAIDFTDPDRKTLIAGTHENHNVFWLSRDRGATFTDIGKNLPVGNCTTTFLVDSQTFLVGCSGYGGGFTGIIRSTDGGTSWDMVSTDGGGPWPLRASDGSIYWTNVNGGVSRSTNDGQSWKKMSDGGNVVNVVELPDGRIASLSRQALVISSDHGATWKVASPPLPPVANGVVQVTYSVHQKAFFGTHPDCRPTVDEDSLIRYDFDFETR